MTTNIKNYAVFILVIIPLSCYQPSVLNADDVMNWYKKNNELFINSKSLGDITYEMRYIPEPVVRAHDTQKITLQGAEQKEVITDQIHFVYKIQNNASNKDLLRKGITGEQPYFERVEYFSYYAHNDFKLVQGSDTLQCQDVHFERTFGLTPYITLNLTFLTKKNSLVKNGNFTNGITLEYYDRVYGNGKVKHYIPEKNLRKIPKLKE